MFKDPKISKHYVRAPNTKSLESLGEIASLF